MEGLEEQKVRLWTPDEVLRMVDAGILHEDEPVELLEGRLVVVSPQGPPHSSLVTWLTERVRAAYGSGFTVREDKPLHLTDGLPEPDIAVVRGRVLDYFAHHPIPADVVLVVEIALTSQSYDRRKARSYARGGVAVMWLLDVPARRLEVRTDPRPDGQYAGVRILDVSEEISLPGTDIRWRVGDLLP